MMRNKTIRSRRAGALAQRVGILLAWLALLTTVISARAQVDKRTVDRVHRLALSLKRVPSNWDIRVLPEIEWRKVRQFYSLSSEAETAISIRQRHITMIRGSYADAADEWEVRYTLAHEAGHIFCQCASEETADKLSKRLLHD